MCIPLKIPQKIQKMNFNLNKKKMFLLDTTLYLT